MTNEIVNAATGAASDVGKAITNPLWDAMGGSLGDVWQALLGDRVAAWRIRRAIDLGLKFEEDCKARGVNPNMERIPEGYAVTWFDRATEADEPEIQELFVKLLASAADGDDNALTKRNIQIVSLLSPRSALLVNHLADMVYNSPQWHASPTPNFKINQIYQSFALRLSMDYGFNDTQALEDLVNLGVLRLDVNTKIDYHRVSRRLGGLDSIDLSRAISNEAFIMLTLTGQSLIKALYPDGCPPHSRRHAGEKQENT